MRRNGAHPSRRSRRLYHVRHPRPTDRRPPRGVHAWREPHWQRQGPDARISRPNPSGAFGGRGDRHRPGRHPFRGSFTRIAESPFSIEVMRNLRDERPQAAPPRGETCRQEGGEPPPEERVEEIPGDPGIGPRDGTRIGEESVGRLERTGPREVRCPGGKGGPCGPPGEPPETPDDAWRTHIRADRPDGRRAGRGADIDVPCGELHGRHP